LQLQNCRGERYDGQNVHYSVMSAPNLGDGRIGIRFEYDSGTNISYFVLDAPFW
jgi:hypothetical protein